MQVRKISVKKQARWRNFRLSYINGIRFTRDSHPQYIIKIKCSKLNFLALILVIIRMHRKKNSTIS